MHFHYSCCPQLYMSTKAVVSGYTVYMYTTAVVHSFAYSAQLFTAVVHSSTCPVQLLSIVLNVHLSCCSQFCIFGIAVYSCCPYFFRSTTAVVHSSICSPQLLSTVKMCFLFMAGGHESWRRHQDSAWPAPRYEMPGRGSWWWRELTVSEDGICGGDTTLH